MTINITYSLVRMTLIHMNQASPSALSVSIIICHDSFVKNIATCLDPLVVCRREVPKGNHQFVEVFYFY